MFSLKNSFFQMVGEYFLLRQPPLEVYLLIIN